MRGGVGEALMPAPDRERLVRLTIATTGTHQMLQHVLDSFDTTLWASVKHSEDSLEDTVARTVGRALAEQWIEKLLLALIARFGDGRREFAKILAELRAADTPGPGDTPDLPVGLDWPTEILGRGRELDELHRVLVVERKNLVAIHGQPGIGKTRLVDEFRRRAVANRWFAGGVVVNRDSVEEIDRQLTAQRTYSRAFPDTIFDKLPNERSLIAFDTLEERDDIAKLLELRTRASRDCAILLTIMERSAMPQGSGHVIELAPLADDVATALLVELAGKPNGRFDEIALHNAVEWAGGIPLLLQMVAGRLADPFDKQQERSWRQIVDELRDDKQPSGDRYERLFERIDRALRRAPHARSLLLAATLFHFSGFPRKALYEVAAIPEDDDTPLRRLYELGLLRCIDRAKDRWAVHNYMHTLASDAFARDPGVQTQRAGQHHRLLAAMTERLFASTGFSAMRGYESTIRRAFDKLSEDELAFLWNEFRIAHKAIDFSAIDLVLSAAQRRELWTGLLGCTYRALPNGASAEGELLRGLCLLNLGKAELHDQQLNQAKAHLVEASRVLRAGGEQRWLADALLCQSDVLRADNEVAAAIDCLTEAASFLDSDSRELGSCHRKLGMCFERAGDFRAAHWHIQKALDLHKYHSDSSEWTNDIAYDCCRLGTILFHMGRLDEAAYYLNEAVRKHTEKVGPDSAFVAYDLNRLGQVELARGNLQDAVDLQDRAHTIHARISGKDSTEAAIDALRLAETLLERRQLADARSRVRQAEKIYEKRHRAHSPHFGYVLALGAKIALAEDRIDDALDLAQRAVDLVSRTQRRIIHRPIAQRIRGEVQLAAGNARHAVDALFEARDGFAQFGMLRDFQQTSALLDAALLARDTAAWDRSAVEYSRYLDAYPDGLHGRVAVATAELLGHEIARTAPHTSDLWVVDLCCGTGILGAALDRAQLPVNVLGLDGPAMVAQATHNRSRLAAPIGKHRFIAMRGDWPALLATEVKRLPGRVLAIHLGLAIFQFGVRERHLLLQAISAAVDPGTLFVFSTYAADFEFPPGCGEASSNELNLFKKVLYEAWEERGWKPPRSYEQALRPVFPKDSVAGLRQLLSVHGFELETDVPTAIRVDRTGADRVAFSRLEAISEKLFGEPQAADRWNAAARDLEGFRDVTWATVLQARRTTSRGPKYLFLPPWKDARVLSRIDYTAAVAIVGPDRRTLLAKRGPAARDFRGAWSLPSAKADHARDLEAVLRENVAQTLALTDLSLELVAIRPALRTEGDRLWVNNLCVYRGRTAQAPIANGQKYSELTYWSVETFLEKRLRFDDHVGDCVKAYWDWLQLEYASPTQ